MTATMKASLPCAVVTGALGSGKTTVIRDLMTRDGMKGTALIINEFGEVGLDHLLVSSAVETTLLMENGCLCCSLRGDLVDTVLSLLSSVERGEVEPFDRIVIETTGLADPLPIVRDLTAAGSLHGKVHLAGVTTCVDGVLGQAELEADHIAIAQVAQADLCLFTKSDLADPLNLDQLREKVQKINPLAAILVVHDGHLPNPDILFDTSKQLERQSNYVSSNRPTNSHASPLHNHSHRHDPSDQRDESHPQSPHAGVESWSILLDHPLPWASFRDWFDLVYSLKAAQMLRMKGLLWIEERDDPLLVQAVGPIVAPFSLQSAWPEATPQTRLVLIAKGLSAAAIAKSFQVHVMKNIEIAS